MWTRRNGTRGALDGVQEATRDHVVKEQPQRPAHPDRLQDRLRYDVAAAEPAREYDLWSLPTRDLHMLEADELGLEPVTTLSRVRLLLNEL